MRPIEWCNIISHRVVWTDEGKFPTPSKIKTMALVILQTVLYLCRYRGWFYNVSLPCTTHSPACAVGIRSKFLSSSLSCRAGGEECLALALAVIFSLRDVPSCHSGSQVDPPQLIVVNSLLLAEYETLRYVR